jgi:hippurate hydrolase
MGVSFRDDAAAIQGDLVELRKALHRHPEVGLALPHTQERVLAELDGLGLEITTGAETTSVVGVLRGGRRDDGDPRAVLIRGDMDALPVDEQTGLDFAATNGAMHACGHDLHTTALVGAARLLAGHRDGLEGDVVFMFQPGEEGFDGASVMIREGVLEASGKRVDAAYAMHVFSSHLPTGIFCSRPGTIMSASHGLFVTVRGAGGHGSAPHRARDPIVVVAQMILALQTTVTRTFDIFDPVVITVGKVNGGSKRNVIPDTASFEATVRRYSEESEQLLDGAIKRTLEGVAAAHGVDVEFRFEKEYPTTVNAPAEVEFAADVVRDVLGEERYRELPKPLSGSEDFSRVIAEVPGAFLVVGATPPGRHPESAPMNHSPRADFDPAVLSDAAAVYAGLAARKLDALATEPTS